MMLKVKNKLNQFVNYLLTTRPPIQPVLKDDVLFDILGVLLALVCNKYLRPLSFGFFGSLILDYVVEMSFVAITNQWNLLLSQYAALVAGALVMLCFYVMTFTTEDEFHELYYNIFPELWDLHEMGEETFKTFEKTATRLVLGYKISIILCILAGTCGLPWFGDDYEMMLPVRVFTDIFGKWSFPFIFIFYLSFYHSAFTTLGCITGILYLMMHLYNQCFLLNKRLENLNNDVDTRGNEDYQNRVNQELTSCIRLHQTLVKFLACINDFLYYKMFYSSGCGVLFILAILLVPKSYVLMVRIGFTVVLGGLVTMSFCLLGQLVEDEFERTFYVAVDTPWYLWNTKNRKLLQLLLQQSQREMVVSSSGIITMNFMFLIRLYRTVYSVSTFLWHFTTMK